ncbi:hypothetical protein B0H21DRAFT_862722 [Amylocystis lapponica]|nr:hypothetical protein B0H21DRAFT_862722 [Amylocystis lapponica]
MFISEGPYRKTISMSLVHVFVAVARRLDIQASPTNFPGKVLCHIAVADPAAPDMLFDMYSDSPPRAFCRNDPVRMLADIGLSPIWASYVAARIFLFHTVMLHYWLLARATDCKLLDVVTVVIRDGICPALVPAMQTIVASMCARQLDMEEEPGGVVWPHTEAGIVRFFGGLLQSTSSLGSWAASAAGMRVPSPRVSHKANPFLVVSFILRSATEEISSGD